MLKVVEEIQTPIKEEFVDEKKEELKTEPEMSETDLKGLSSGFRSMYVQEKIRGTELGQLDFSEYLRKVVPEQKELIKYIKEQENLTRNMYAEYINEIIYRRENNYPVIDFKQFIRVRYDVKDYYDLEVPMDVEEKLNKEKSL